MTIELNRRDRRALRFATRTRTGRALRERTIGKDVAPAGAHRPAGTGKAALAALAADRVLPNLARDLREGIYGRSAI